MEWFKTLRQKQYIQKINKSQGTKGLQKLINLSMKQLQENNDNALDSQEIELISKLLSESLIN